MKKLVKPQEPAITIFPYPVYLISCEYKRRRNITTVSWASPLCYKPLLFGISLRLTRFSYQLIRNSRKFALNIPTQEILEDVDYCGTFTGKNVNKNIITTLTYQKTEENSPPIITECPVNLECKVKDIMDLGSHALFIGELDKILIDESVLNGQISNLFIAIGTSYYVVGTEIGKCQLIYKKKFRGE